jgi:predicted ferric reductase
MDSRVWTFMKTKALLAWTGIFLVGIFPAILLFMFGPGNYSSITHTLGQISGLMGMTFFALTFILSTRAKWIEDLFDGLDKTYPVHAVLGAVSLILLLLHPIFLVMKFIPQNMKLAAIYLLPGGLISVDFGIFALLGMILLLMVTFYSKMKYNRWKFSHEFLGFLFALAILHIFLVCETVARDYIFNGYYAYAAVVSIIGLGGFFYSLLRNKLFGKKYVIERFEKVNGCFEIILKPLGEGIRFRAGQFIFVKFHNKIVGKESHPFSIASSSGNGNIRIIVKDLGDYTSQLGKLKEGNKMIVEGPYGRFHGTAYREEIWIAGGIGITPFLGLAEDLRKNRDGHIDLYYSVKNKEEFVHLEELQDIAKSNKNFRVFPWVSDEKGYLSLNEISKTSSIKNKEFYLCGPESLKITIKKALFQKNISTGSIHDERFAFK